MIKARTVLPTHITPPLISVEIEGPWFYDVTVGHNDMGSSVAVIELSLDRQQALSLIEVLKKELKL